MAGNRVLVVGYLSVDTVQQPDGSTRKSPGGAALYAALGARRAGAAVDLAASVGMDYPAAWLSAMEADGIGLTALKHRDIPSRWALIRHHNDGTRESLHYADPAWWAASEAHVPSWPALEGFGAVVACPMPVICLAHLLDDAAAAQVPVVADTNEAFSGSDSRDLLSLIHRLDVFAPSREETRLLLPEKDDADAARHLARSGASVVQKLGAEGIFVVETGGVGEWRIPALDAQVVDPTGAGDATIGAIAAGRVHGKSVHVAAREALRIGALAVSGIGPEALGLHFQSTRSAKSMRRV